MSSWSARRKATTGVTFLVAAAVAVAGLRGPRAAGAEVTSTASAAPTVPSASAPRAGPTPPIEVLFHADLDGRFAARGCEREQSRAPGFARLVGALSAERAEASEAPREAPVVVMGGNLVAPELVARGVFVRGAAGADALAALVAGARYDAVALGHHELSLAPEALEALVAGLAARGVPVVATNLTCDATRVRLCQSIRRWVLIRRGQALVGVMAVLSPSVLPGVNGPARAGLGLEEVLGKVRETTRALRAAGATQVILMNQGPRDRRGLQEIDALQRAFERAGDRTPDRVEGAADPAVGTPDIILAGGLADEDSGQALRWLRRDTAPGVVGSQPGAASLSRVLLSGTGETLSVDALELGGTPASVVGGGNPAGTERGAGGPRGARAIAPDPATAARLAPELAEACARERVPVSAAPVRGSLSREDFITYVLEIMRRRAGAEVAVINRAAVRRTPFPLVGRITRGDLLGALPYPAVIGTARMTGGALEATLGPDVSARPGPGAGPSTVPTEESRLATVGLTRSEGALLVNGRPLDKARDYQIATIAFVASGGDGLVAPGAMRWSPVDGAPDLREAVATFLEQETAAADGDPTVDPRTDFGTGADARTLVIGLTDLGADLSDTRIANRADYGDAQLARADQLVLKGEATGILQLRHPVHEADTRLNLKYAWTRSRPVDGPATSGETTDLITFSSLYNYRGWRLRRPSPPREIPDPYARVGLESEFTRPPVTPTQPRTFHHLELTNTVGGMFTLVPALKVRAGAGVRKELLATADVGRWRPVLEAGAALSPLGFPLPGTPLAVKLEGLLDYSFVDPAGLREHQLRGSGKLSVPLLPPLFITAGLDVFAVERQGQGWGASYDTTVGLRIHLDDAHQSL
jgi:2',3'-cyclic-nucleotide 2'-phosphodiesterase (5'-nucleotidase family)